MKILIPAILDNYSPRKDNTFSVKFLTQELSNEQLLNINSARDKFGILYFKAESDITNEELEKLDEVDIDITDKSKTPSKRIRSVLFRNWQQDNKGFTEFKNFYIFETERIIEHYKSKLE